MQDLLAGQIDVMFDRPPTSLPHLRGGKIKAYAVPSKDRACSGADIPTIDEAGMPGFYMTVWQALWVPRGTPKEVIAQAQCGRGRCPRRSRRARTGLPISVRRFRPATQQTPEALGALHKAEIEKWWPIIKAANIKGE